MPEQKEFAGVPAGDVVKTPCRPGAPRASGGLASPLLIDLLHDVSREHVDRKTGRRARRDR